MFLFRPFVWIWVLLRHDAAEALAALVPSQGPLRVLYRLARLLGASDAELDDERGGDEPGTRLAYALRALGPTFIKVGQIISTRADLLGDDIAQQLSVLHDQLPLPIKRPLRSNLLRYSNCRWTHYSAILTETPSAQPALRRFISPPR